MRLAIALFGLGLAGCGCDGVVTPELVLEEAESLDGANDTFCARTAEGLTCFDAGSRGLGTPRAVEGLSGEVREVAFMLGQACALDAEGVACWANHEPVALRMRALGEVRELRSMSGFRGRFCALDARGAVACWRRPDETPYVLEPSGIAHLHTTTDDDMICAETTVDRTIRCHEFHDEASPHRTLESSAIAPPVRRIAASTTSGELWVLDAQGLERGRGLGSIVVTDPFGDPLAAGNATLREIPRQRVELAPAAGAESVRELLGTLPWLHLHDARGIRMVVDHLGELEESRRYDFGAPPEALLAVDGGLVFALAGGELLVRGRIEGDPVERRIEGVRAPEEVVVGLFWFCVLHADGVSCAPRIEGAR